MSNKVLFIVALVIVVGITGVIFFYNRPGKTAVLPPANPTQNPQVSQKQQGQTNVSGASPSQESENEKYITVGASGFEPQALTVKAGTKVTWKNKSGDTVEVASSPHPAHTDYPPLNLGSLASGSEVSLVFDKPGTYKYHNHLNPGQFGRIVVE